EPARRLPGQPLPGRGEDGPAPGPRRARPDRPGPVDLPRRHGRLPPRSGPRRYQTGRRDKHGPPGLGRRQRPNPTSKAGAARERPAAGGLVAPAARRRAAQPNPAGRWLSAERLDGTARSEALSPLQAPNRRPAMTLITRPEGLSADQ